jgi:hypothetical protein
MSGMVDPGGRGSFVDRAVESVRDFIFTRRSPRRAAISFSIRSSARSSN